MPLPDSETRKEIFKIGTRKMPLSKDVILDNLVERTDMFSGAEVGTILDTIVLYYQSFTY